MKIGYRRYSGPCFTDATKVKSHKGAYLAKRIALLEALKGRGNEVTILQKGDDFSSYERIFVEFGSTNYMFHKPDIDYSNEILKSGKAIFFLDDPDMMPKELFGARVWVNADAYLCSKKWKITCEYFPVSALQPQRSPSPGYNDKIVYYGGTSGGRERMLRQYQVFIPNLEIYGDEKEYSHIKPLTPPSESERENFYAGFKLCLNVNDGLHKKLKWRTGRKYDAIIAGCPAVDETPQMFGIIKTMDDEARMELIHEQQIDLIKERATCSALLDSVGM